MEIKETSKVKEVLRNYPRTHKVFKKHGMLCPSCKGSENDTLLAASRNHGVPLEQLLSELKEASRPGR